ncbi:MAG TPA: ABC transporter permease [Actinomycetota bacterium]
MSAPKAIAIAGVNLRRLTRDRTGMFFVFVFPFLIILAIGAAFGAGFTPRLGVVAAGSGPLGQDLRGRLTASEHVTIRGFADDEALRTAVERAEVEGGVVIPGDYDARVRAGETVEVTYLARPTDTSRELEVAVRAVLDEQGATIRAARFALEEGSVATFEEGLERARRVASAIPRVSVDARTPGGTAGLGTFATGAAQELVLFMFLTSLSASSMLIETRRFGITRRMLASPTPVRSILVGEALGRYAIALVQGILIVVGTAILFQVEWGNLATTTAVVLLFGLAATGAAMVMGSVLRSAAQAGAMGVFLGLVFAALGGSMVPLEIFPPVMARIAHLIPHAWAIEALTASITDGTGPAGVATQLLVLAAYAVGLLAVATVLLRRAITSHAT